MLALVLFCLIQGFTEFLPISSQGHLIIFNSIYPIEIMQALLSRSYNNCAFWFTFGYYNFLSKSSAKSFVSIKMIDRPDIDKNSFILINLIISTIPIMVAGYVIFKILDYNWDGLYYHCNIKYFFGIILF